MLALIDNQTKFVTLISRKREQVMSMNIQERIAQLQKEQAQLKARAQKLQSQSNEKERKTIDRRKYIVGGLILKDIEINKGLRDYVTKCLTGSPERIKQLFPDLFTNHSATTQITPKQT